MFIHAHDYTHYKYLTTHNLNEVVEVKETQYLKKNLNK